MPSVAYTLSQDIYVLLDLFKDEHNFEAMSLMNHAVDRADQISKFHLPTSDFFTRLKSDVHHYAGVHEYSPEMPALKELLEVIEEHRTRYCS